MTDQLLQDIIKMIMEDYSFRRSTDIKIPDFPHHSKPDKMVLSFTHTKYGLARVCIKLTDDGFIYVIIPSLFTDYNNTKFSMMQDFDKPLREILDSYVKIVSTNYNIYKEYLHLLENYDKFYTSIIQIFCIPRYNTTEDDRRYRTFCNNQALLDAYKHMWVYAPYKNFDKLNMIVGFNERSFVEIYSMEHKTDSYYGTEYKNYIYEHELNKRCFNKLKKEHDKMRRSEIAERKNPKQLDKIELPKPTSKKSK